MLDLKNPKPGRSARPLGAGKLPVGGGHRTGSAQSPPSAGGDLPQRPQSLKKEARSRRFRTHDLREGRWSAAEAQRRRITDREGKQAGGRTLAEEDSCGDV